MADSIFHPTYHSPIYQPATYSTKKGVRMARFRLPKSGKYVTGVVMPSGEAPFHPHSGTPTSARTASLSASR